MSRKAFKEYRIATTVMNKPILRGVIVQDDILGANVQRGGLALGLDDADPCFSEK